MGELSKKIGEDGERLVRNFLAMIGWNDALEGTSIGCLKAQKHADGDQKNGRQTHGIDLLYPQKKQLEDFRAEHAIISVKFSQKPYPSQPSLTFKKHITDLAHTIECYKNSEKHREMSKMLSGSNLINSESFVGLLFWLTSDKGDNQDVISKISGSNISADLKFETIQVVDNNRAQFIYDAISAAKSRYPNQKISFNYSRFSENFIDRTIPTHGASMPSEYFSASIIPMRVNNPHGETTAFIVAVDEDFSKETLRRIISWVTDATQGLPNEFCFLFRKFNESSDSTYVKEALLENREQLGEAKVNVQSVNNDFRSMLNERE